MKKYAILSISLLTVMTNAAISPVLGTLSQAFPQASLTTIRMFLSLPSLAAIFFTLLGGILALHISKRVILFTGLTLYLIGGVGAGFGQNLTTLLALRAVLGAGAGLIVPLSTTLIADFYKGDERARLIGYSTSVAHFAAVIMPFIAGWLTGINWRYAFTVYLLALFVLLFTALYLPEPPRLEPEKQGQKTIMPKSIFSLALAAMGLMMVFFIIPTGISLFLEIEGIGDARVAGLSVSLSTLAVLFIGIIFSRLFKSLKQYFWGAGLIILALGFWLLYYSSSAAVVFISSFIIGCGLGLLFPGIMVHTTQRAPPQAVSTAVSLVASASSLGQFLSPLFFGAAEKLAAEPSVRFDFAVAAAVLSLASIIAFLIPTTKRGRG